VIFGRLEHEDLKLINDLNWREVLVFAPMIILVLWMGIYPATFLDGIQIAASETLRSSAAAASSIGDVGALFAWLR
jgi:NADH-quinone oxidoreductase subunit M